MKRDPVKALLTREPGSGAERPDAAAATPAVSSTTRRVRNVVIAVLLLAMVALAVGGWSVQKNGRVLSRVALVRGDLTDVGSRFTGVLLTQQFLPGKHVRKGEILARLDDRHLRAQESESVAQLEALERDFALERVAIAQERSSRATRVEEVQARALAAQGEIRAAKLRLSEAEAFQGVRQQLANEGIISVDAIREVQNRTNLAREGVSVSVSNGSAAASALRNSELELAALAIREQHLGVLEAQLAAARARLERVRADIASTEITAPADGTVVRWWINAGGSVDVGKPIVSLSLGERRWIEAWIDEDEASRIRVGDTAIVTLPFQGGRELEGKVARIGVTTEGDPPQVIPLEPRPTRIRLAPAVSVEVALGEVPETLLPGLSAAVAIQPRR